MGEGKVMEGLDNGGREGNGGGVQVMEGEGNGGGVQVRKG